MWISILETGVARARYILRLIPIVATCKVGAVIEQDESFVKNWRFWNGTGCACLDLTLSGDRRTRRTLRRHSPLFLVHFFHRDHPLHILSSSRWGIRMLVNFAHMLKSLRRETMEALGGRRWSKWWEMLWGTWTGNLPWTWSRPTWQLSSRFLSFKLPSEVLLSIFEISFRNTLPARLYWIY